MMNNVKVHESPLTRIRIKVDDCFNTLFMENVNDLSVKKSI